MTDPVPFDIAARQRQLAEARLRACEDCVSGSAGEVIARTVHGQDEVLFRLLDAGAPMGDALDHALLAAARSNRPGLIRALAARGAPLDDMAAEIHAAAAAHDSVPVLLAMAGFDINQPDALGWPPLFHAAVNGRLLALDILLERGADRHFRDRQGFTAAERALAAGQRAAFDLLSPMPLPPDLDGVDLAEIDRLFLLAAATNRPSGFEPLIRAGADLGLLGGEALCAAAHAGAIDAARWLLMAEVPVDGRNAAGDTALLKAAASRSTTVVGLLMAWGAAADVELLRDRGHHAAVPHVVRALGTRALFKAVWDDSPEGIDAAMAAGADVNGRTCFSVTYLGGRRHEGSETPLTRAATTGRAKAAGRLARVPSIDLEAETGLPFQTALYRAVSFGQPEIALALLEAGADARRPARLTGQTPLDLAIERNDLMLIGRLKRWRPRRE